LEGTPDGAAQIGEAVSAVPRCIWIETGDEILVSELADSATGAIESDLKSFTQFGWGEWPVCIGQVAEDLPPVFRHLDIGDQCPEFITPLCHVNRWSKHVNVRGISSVQQL
jgi:hypothetical protein